jgi:hypothetical protein
MRTDRRGWRWRMVALAATLTAGCQSRDVGDPCWPTIIESGGPPLACTNSSYDTGDYFEGSNLRCDNLICIHSPGEGCSIPASGTITFLQPTGMCSKPCVSDSDCFPEETHMVCRKVVLSEAFISWMEQDPGRAVILQRYLQSIQNSSYCALRPTSG